MHSRKTSLETREGVKMNRWIRVLYGLSIALAPATALATDLTLCGYGNTDWATLCSTAHAGGEPVMSFFQGTLTLDGNCLFLATRNTGSPAYQWVETFCLWNPEILGTVPLFGFTMAQDVPGTVAAIQGRIGDPGGGCPGPLPGTNAASVSVQCFPAWSGSIPVTLPYKRTVTRSNLAETMRSLKYTTLVPVTLRVVARMDYWTRIKDQSDQQPVRMLYGWAEGSSALLPGDFKFATVNGIFTMTVTYDLEPGTYIFAFEETAWTFPFTAFTPAIKDNLPPPDTLGEYEFSEVLPPGLAIHAAPGNHPEADLPGVLPDPPTPFDLLHFRLSLSPEATDSVAIRELGVMLDGKPELGDFARATLHEDPTCSGGTGTMLAFATIQGLTSFEHVFFTPSSEQTFQPGQERCYTVRLEPKPRPYVFVCPCDRFRGEIWPPSVNAVFTSTGATAPVQGETVHSYHMGDWPRLQPLVPTRQETSHFQKKEVPVRMEPGDCAFPDWSAHYEVVQAPRDAFQQGVGGQGGPFETSNVFPFPEGAAQPTVHPFFRAGSRTGTYVVEATPFNARCTVDLPSPKVRFQFDVPPAPIVVNSKGSGADLYGDDGLCFTGQFTGQGEPECTLTAAIQEANARPGHDTIGFLDSTDYIRLEEWTAPPLQCPATVDGSTAPFIKHVVISGQDLTGGQDGLVLEGSGCRLVHVTVTSFPGTGIRSSGDLALEQVAAVDNGLNGVRSARDLTVLGSLLNTIRDNGFGAPVGDRQHGIYVEQGRIVIQNATVENNAGRGIVLGTASREPSRLTNVQILLNQQGGARFDGDVTMTRCAVDRNLEGGIVARSVAMDGTVVTDNGGLGAQVIGGTFEALASSFIGNEDGGLLLRSWPDGASEEGESLVNASLFLSNGGHGVEYQGGPLVSIHQSTIENNEGYGVFNSSETEWVDARWNWWGAPDGPGGEGPGQGDEVSERVLTEFFARERFPVQVVPESEPVLVVPGQEREVRVTVLDPAHPTGSVTLSHEDAQGWIQGPRSIEVTLSNGIGTAILPVLAPEGAQGVNAVPLLAVPNGNASKPGRAVLYLATTSDADLKAAISQEFTAVLPGADIAWTVTVSNLGPGFARDVTARLDVTGAGGPLEALAPLDSSCEQDGASLSCRLGGIAPGSRVEVGLRAKASSTEGQVTLSIEARSESPDPVPSNNVATKTTTVTTVPPVPDARVKPASLAFSTVGIGGWTSPRTLRVTNEGTAPLNVSGVTIQGQNPGDFVVRDDGCAGRKVLPGEECQVSVAFVPSGQGDRTAALAVASDDPDTSTFQVTLAGRGAVPPEVPELLSPDNGATVPSGDVTVTYLPSAGAGEDTRFTVVACEEETFEGCGPGGLTRRAPVRAPLAPWFLLAGLLVVPWLSRPARRWMLSLALVTVFGVSLSCGGEGTAGRDLPGPDLLPTDLVADASPDPGSDAVTPWDEGPGNDATGGDAGAEVPGPDTRSRTLTGLKPNTAYWWKVVETRADGTVLESEVRRFVTGP